MIVVRVFRAELTVARPAMVELRLRVDAKAVDVTVRVVLQHVTLIVQSDHLFAADLALLEDVKLSNVQMHGSQMGDQVLLAVEELAGAAVALKWLEAS